MSYIIEIFGESYEAYISKHHYHANKMQTIVELKDAETGEPCGPMTTCIPGAQLEMNETILKPMEGIDIVDVLVKAGIAVETGKSIRSGYAKYPVVKLSQQFLTAE